MASEADLLELRGARAQPVKDARQRLVDALMAQPLQGGRQTRPLGLQPGKARLDAFTKLFGRRFAAVQEPLYPLAPALEPVSFSALLQPSTQQYAVGASK